jgi:hypothetical protein
MSRPALPPEAFCKSIPTFQFPKSLLQPLIRPWIRMQDAGILPAVPLAQHLVICGFPRSGTTLFQLIIESCVDGIKTFGRERRALEIAKYGRRTHSRVMTKRPKDIFLLPELRNFYASHHANVRFILMSRDPRAILTSVHFSNPSDYFVSADQWRHIYRHWKWSVSAADVLTVRYEDLITIPEMTEHQVAQLTGWPLTRPFRDFYNFVPSEFDGRALNGLRALDETNLRRWQDESHRQRIIALLQELPELPDVLIDLGYETDDAWTRPYKRALNVRPSAA